MSSIGGADGDPMSSIPSKDIRYLISVDDIDKGDHFPLSSIGFDETKYRWNSRVFHTGGSDKNWNGPISWDIMIILLIHYSTLFPDRIETDFTGRLSNLFH